jgi:hypothetical protein
VKSTHKHQTASPFRTFFRDLVSRFFENTTRHHQTTQNSPLPLPDHIAHPQPSILRTPTYPDYYPNINLDAYLSPASMGARDRYESIELFSAHRLIVPPSAHCQDRGVYRPPKCVYCSYPVLPGTYPTRTSRQFMDHGHHGDHLALPGNDNQIADNTIGDYQEALRTSL